MWDRGIWLLRARAMVDRALGFGVMSSGHRAYWHGVDLVWLFLLIFHNAALCAMRFLHGFDAR